MKAGSRCTREYRGWGWVLRSHSGGVKWWQSPTRAGQPHIMAAPVLKSGLQRLVWPHAGLTIHTPTKVNLSLCTCLLPSF